MGLLDDLKAEREKIQSQREAEQTEVQRKKEVYRQLIRPQIKALFNFLQEVVQHLNYIEPNVTVDYLLPGNMQTGDLKQKNYVITTDSSDKMMEISLRCDAVTERPFMIPAETDQAAATFSEQLRQYGLIFAKRSAAGSGIKCASLLEITPSVPIHFNFKVDTDKEGVLLTLKNYAVLGVQKEFMKAEEFGDQWLEDIGQLILRKGDQLIHSKLSDEERLKIKEHLISEGNPHQEQKQAMDVTAKQRARSAWEMLFGKKR